MRNANGSFLKDTSERRKALFLPLIVFPLSKLQLLANQNLKFIDPFCKVAAKTKE